MYQNNNQPVPDLMTAPSRQMNTTVTSQQQQQQVRSRNALTNQSVNSVGTRFPQTSSSINGSNNVIQAAASSTSLNTMHNNVNNSMPINSRPQQQHRSNSIQNCGEIIDLSSPPHSPQRNSYNAANAVPSVPSSSHSHNSLPPLQRISDAPQLMANGLPQYKVSLLR